MLKLLAIGCLTACGGSSTKPAPPIDNHGGVGAPAPDLPKDAVVIRACNDTKYDFASFQYQDYDEPVTGLAAGACTPWRVVPEQHRAYGYTYAKFTIGAAELTIQPIDYVGETPLAPGRWSYGVTVIDFQKREADIRARREP